MNVNLEIKGLLSREFLHDGEVKALAELLAGEMSALDAYDLALGRIKNQDLKAKIRESRESHAARVERLKARLAALGEDPEQARAYWIARLVEGSAASINDRIALSVLAAGEEFGLEQYKHHMNELDSDSYELVESEILPAQRKTLQTMSSICAQLRSPAHKSEAH